MCAARLAARVAELFLVTIVFGHVVSDPFDAPADLHPYALQNLGAVVTVLLLVRGGDPMGIDGFLRKRRAVAQKGGSPSACPTPTAMLSPTRFRALMRSMIRGTGGRIAERRREGVWPRVYRVRRGQRLFLGGLGLVAVGGGLLGAGAILLGSPKTPPAIALVPLAFVGLGAYLLATVTAERLVLYEDAIEFIGLGRRKRRARRYEIAGLRVVPLQYGYRQVVLELGAGKKPLKVTWAYETDPVLEAWMGAFPDLDAEERARGEAELLRSAALGVDEDERARSLARARKVARVLNGAALTACAWGWLYPRPYSAAVVTLGVLPLIGLATLLGGRGRYGFDTRRNDPRPSLVLTVIGPGPVLALRAILDVRVLDWKPLLLGAVGGGLVLVTAIAFGDRPRKLWSLALLAPLVSAYPWGALSLANALLDRETPEVFRTAVRGKHISGGKHTSFDLELDPWGPVTDRESVDVGRPLYDAVSQGDDVCVALHPGALGVRWYVVLRCRAPGT